MTTECLKYKTHINVVNKIKYTHNDILINENMLLKRAMTDKYKILNTTLQSYRLQRQPQTFLIKTYITITAYTSQQTPRGKQILGQEIIVI